MSRTTLPALAIRTFALVYIATICAITKTALPAFQYVDIRNTMIARPRRFTNRNLILSISIPDGCMLGHVVHL